MLERQNGGRPSKSASVGSGVIGERKALLRKYGSFMEGLKGNAWNQLGYAQLFENQMQNIKEAHSSRNPLAENTAASAIPDHVRFVFPTLRRFFSNLIAPELLSMQAMNSPVGGFFYWEYKYATTKGKITAGQNLIETFDHNYSSEFVNLEDIGNGNGATTVFSVTLNNKPVKAKTSSQVGLRLKYVVGGTTYDQVVDDGDGTLSGTHINTSSTINYTTGALSITFTTAPDTATDIFASYYCSMEGAAGALNVPGVDIDITLAEVKVQSRKIKINYNSEGADDMRAVLGQDIDEELSAGVASQMSLEVDREMIQNMRNSGTTILDSFDATVPNGINAVDHYRGLLTSFTRASMKIATRVKKGPGNWMVVGPEIAALMSQLETHGYFKSVYDKGAPPVGIGTQAMAGAPLPGGPEGYGVFELGVLQNRWKVYVDPYFQAEAETVKEVLIGRKGTEFHDAGYAYGPYIPMQMTQSFLDPSNWAVSKGVRTRYAQKLLNANYYAKVEVTGL